MALQKTERHPVNSTTPEFLGYWAAGPMGIDPQEKIFSIRLSLYYNVNDYIASPKGNVLRSTDTFTFTGSEYDEILPPENTPIELMPTIPQILYLVYMKIKNRVDDEGNPGYFADADIVP